MDFVALDFETANSRADSACQLALVMVSGNEIVDEHCWLVRPPRLYFSPRNISIHGIRAEHVARAPTMQELWPKLAQLLDGQVLVAHNAGFDIGVLVASLAAYDIACPTLEFSCTRAIARRAWPGRSRYGLKPLGNWLGIEFKHHDALEDARCCAHIAMTAAGATAYATFADFEKALRISRGRYCLGQVRNRAALAAAPLSLPHGVYRNDRGPQSQLGRLRPHPGKRALQLKSSSAQLAAQDAAGSTRLQFWKHLPAHSPWRKNTSYAWALSAA